MSGELCYVGCWNSLVGETLHHVFWALWLLNLGFPDQPSLPFPSSAHQVVCVDLWTTICSNCFWPSHGLLSNKTGSLLLSCRQVFSVQIACTLQLGLSHYCLWQTFSVLKASYQRHSRRLVFSFAVRCTVKTRHRPPFYSELHHPSTYCDVPEFLEDRNGGYCLAKESWEALLDLRFQEDLCCTGPSFPLLLQVQTHWLVASPLFLELFLLGVQRFASFLKH